MHNDGIVYFPILRSQRGLIVENNEYTDDGLLFPDGQKLDPRGDQQVVECSWGINHRSRPASWVSRFHLDMRRCQGKWEPEQGFTKLLPVSDSLVMSR
ncbi:MAG: hypothetical protein A4E19_06330 [Nitrospira sp. SG-bin1]|nr:MAG: hypothetical protein A4E19_06330 [Nitrospira sp. SG-bin1]